MTRFVCITQHSDTHGIVGPSGKLYTSVQNLPFEVKDKQDIVYFKQYPQRFKIETIVERVIKKVAPKKGVASATDKEEKNLDQFLNKLSITEEGKEKIRKLYGNFNNLYAEHIAGAKFGSLRRKDAKTLLKALEKRDDQPEDEA